MKKIVGLLLVAGNLMAASPIVSLYEERLTIARLEERKAARVVRYLTERKASLEEASMHGSVPGSSVLEVTRQLGMAESTHTLLAKQIGQAETLLRLAKARTEARQDMPFCFKD